MTDLYDQWIDAMKARERCCNSHRFNPSAFKIRCNIERRRNTERLAAYKRKRADYTYLASDLIAMALEYQADVSDTVRLPAVAPSSDGSAMGDSRQHSPHVCKWL